MNATSTLPPVAEEAAAGLPALPPLLRVLSGRLAGAEHPVPRDRSIRVGHAFDNDVVLRGAETAGLALELHAAGQATMLRMLAGEIVVLGRELKAGEEMMLPDYLPVRLGEFAFAIGADDPARWDEAAALARTVAQPIGDAGALERPRVSLGERVAVRAGGWSSRARGRVLRVAATAAGLGALVLALPTLDRWLLSDARDPAAASAALASAGFRDVRVTVDPATSSLLFTGVVADERAADRLHALVDTRFAGSQVEVEPTTAMAAAATDMLQQNHIDADAKVAAPGVLAITAQYLPRDRQAELTDILVRDIPGLKRVDYRIDSARGPQDLRYFFNSKQYGLASFVDGDPGYIVTADGTRWFKGAVLPTGHRILAIGGGAMTLERGGQTEILKM